VRGAERISRVRTKKHLMKETREKRKGRYNEGKMKKKVIEGKKEIKMQIEGRRKKELNKGI